MTPLDDDQSVTESRDEAVIAGDAMTSDDAALAQWASALRASAVAPPPSAALADLMAHGTGLRVVGGTSAGAAPRRRRRVARVVVGGGVAAALLVGGTAAAAAVRDGVPVSQLPQAITERIGAAVGDVLEAVGVRQRAAQPDPVDVVLPGEPGDVPATSGPGTGEQHGQDASDEAPGRTGDVQDQAPGLDPDGPGASEDAPGHDEDGPGASQDAPGRTTEPGEQHGTGSDGQGNGGGVTPDPGQGAGQGTDEGAGSDQGAGERSGEGSGQDEDGQADEAASASSSAPATGTRSGD